MKSTTILIVFFLLCFGLSSKNVPDRLIDLNKYWQSVSSNSIYSSEIECFNEEELIKYHLLWVIDSLCKVDLNQFDDLQIARRNHLLDRLQAYAYQKRFPQNTYHHKRTPYFIDDYGTACAVGHMIIESGNEDLALKVSEEMNYAYIEDMPYEELEQWADAHGFYLNELKWIQPAYGPQCPPGAIIQPSCAQPAHLAVGCFNPDWQRDSLVQPITYLTEINTGTGWMVDSSNMWMMMGAAPGQYRITLTDVNNRSVVYNYLIAAPLGIVSNDSVVQHSSSNTFCNGKLIVQPSQGNGAYQITLMNQQLPYGSTNSTGIFDSLCPAIYTIIIYDALGCQKTDSAQIQLTTGLNQYTFTGGFQFQNPLKENMLKLQTDLTGPKLLSIYNLKGELIHQEGFSTDQFSSQLDVRNGLYILELRNEGKTIRKKLIVHN